MVANKQSQGSGQSKEQQKNDAITDGSKYKTKIEKTNLDIKYSQNSPYVNDKTTLNSALKFDPSNENRLKSGSPAKAMKHLANSNIKNEVVPSNERENYIYQATPEKLQLDGFKANQIKDAETKHHLTQMRYGQNQSDNKIASERASSVRENVNAHYRTTSENFFPQSSFKNARDRVSSEKEPIANLHKFLKGTTYSIGKKSEPHYLNTVQRNDYEPKQRDSERPAPARGNQEASTG